MLDTVIDNGSQDTVIIECHGESYLILLDEQMTMDEATAWVERTQRRDKTKFVIFRAERIVGVYR